MAARQAAAEQEATRPVSLGDVACFTQLVYPGGMFAREIPWPCKAPIVLVLCTPTTARWLGATFWN